MPATLFKASKTENKNPTVEGLMASKDRAGWRKVRFPAVTRAARVRHDPITLNREEFLPGQTYLLPPLIAEEVLKSIERAEQVPIKQMTGRINMGPELLKELAEQAAFDREQAEQNAQERLGLPYEAQE